MSLAPEDYADVFALFDTVGDGKVFVKHLGDVLRACGQNPTASLLEKCTGDYAPDDRLSLDQFMPIRNNVEKRKPSFSPAEIVEVLRNFDRQGNGFMQTAELKRILTSIGDKLSEEEAQQILEGIENSYGNINYEEFVRIIVSN
ncbi:myosin-2 essential light chain [Galendromus occidentalis]|uniref:Myosin-2 essential light chain n=1 Tax=Galendromus occidentalis TaxID=34638 RepID=A0AAJ6VWL8_9ACAR|nr:myosin-2 essential light chain [Galendromus occidentalis]